MAITGILFALLAAALIWVGLYLLQLAIVASVVVLGMLLAGGLVTAALVYGLSFTGLYLLLGGAHLGWVILGGVLVGSLCMVLVWKGFRHVLIKELG